MVAFHEYDGDKIPIIERVNGHRGLYNMRPDEIDRMRCDTMFSDDGDCMEPGGFHGTAFEDSGIEKLDESQIRELVEFQKAHRSSLYHVCKDAGVPCKDQNGHGYCWAYGLVSAVEAARLHAMQGKGFVELDPHSVAAGYMRGKDRGGWASMALEWIAKHGIVPAGIWPKHSRNHKLWEDRGIQEAADLFRVPESVDVPRGDMQALDSLLASNIPAGIGLMWWGHLIVYLAIDYSNRYGKLRLIRNSHTKRFGRDGYAWVAERPSQHGGGSAVRVAS